MFQATRLIPAGALVGLTVVLAVVLAADGIEASNSAPLDHFRCYDAAGLDSGAEVTLKDQFDEALGVVEQQQVLEAFRFCNPVEKRHGRGLTPIQDETAHLTWYGLSQFGPPPPASVVVVNQFGRQRLTLGNLFALAVPTQKEALAFPANLDHFKCYRADGRPGGGAVVLADQFGSSRVVVREPFVFCNPVEKTHADTVTPVRHPEEHLVCYGTATAGRPEPAPERPVPVANQFNTGILTVHSALELCVPSEKVSVGTSGG